MKKFLIKNKHSSENFSFKSRLFRLFFLAVIVQLIFFSAISCDKEKKVAKSKGYYTCAMHPQVIQPEPGKCPICGMTLTFIETESQEEDDSPHKGHENAESGKSMKKGHKPSKHFRFSVAQKLLLNAQISTVPVHKGKFARVGTYSGHVDYNEDPNHLVIITTKYDGWVEKLYVSKEGQVIRRGQLLLGVYSQKLLAAKEEHLTIFKTMKNLYLSKGKTTEELERDLTLKATRRKLLYLDVPRSEIQSIEKNMVTQRLTYFRSPISGIVVKKEVLQGKFIKAGKQLFQIANLDRLWIFIHIFEKDLPFIKMGDRVEIRAQAYSDKVFRGKIDLIYPFLRQKTRDIPVRIVVGNRKRVLKPGMYVTVEVKSKLRGKVLTIPDISIVYTGNRNYVFVSIGKGKFEVRPIKVYARSQGKTIVSKGLKENELVVANGQFLLDSEASLKEALAKGQMSGHNH